VEYSRHPDFASGWSAGTHAVTVGDPVGSYRLIEELPSGITRCRARFAASRSILKSVRRNGTMLALAVGS
jgi:hypothetical protein